MIAPSGKFDLKFALANFLYYKNDFTENFQGRQSAKQFVKKYKEIIRSTASTRGATNQRVVTVDEDGDVSLTDLPKTPVKDVNRGKKNKRKSTTPVPEGAELLSPEKVKKPNTLDNDIEAHYLGMLSNTNKCFYIMSAQFSTSNFKRS